MLERQYRPAPADAERRSRTGAVPSHGATPEDDMQLDIHVPRFTWPGGPEAIGPTFASLARTAEAIGVRTLSVMDHWFQMEFLWPAEEPMLEGYTALSFAAAKTERLRFRLLVGGVTYRHPGLLAKTVTTLDVLSGGRAELGLGAAWYEREHRGLGVPFPPLSERYERLEETLQICFQMWSHDDGPYEGKHYQLAETLCRPRPVSSPPAGAHRRRRRAQDPAARGDLRRRQQHHRRRGHGRPQGGGAETALRRGRARSGADRGDRAHRCPGGRGLRRDPAGGGDPRRRGGAGDRHPVHGARAVEWLEETWGPIVGRLADI